MMQLVPYIVAAIAAILALYLPRGKDLAVAVALVPWVAFDVEIGLSIASSQAVMVVLIAKYAVLGYLRPERVPGSGWIFLFFAAALVAAYVTMNYGPEVPQFAGGGTMRNGYGRVITTLATMLITFIFAAVVAVSRDKIEGSRLLRTYVLSCAVLAVLGFIQLMVFTMIGIDIFPISMFSPEGRSAAVVLGDTVQLRVSSFGGEPKGFGQSMAIALSFNLLLGPQLRWFPAWRNALSALLFFLVVLSVSSSAFVTLIVVMTIGVILSKNPIPFSRFRVMAMGTSICLGFFVTFYIIAATRDVLAPPVYPELDSLVELIYYGLTDKIKFDDTDAIIMTSFVGDYFGIMFGRGLGLTHHYAYQLVPPHQAYYLDFTVLPAKSGITLYVGYAGLTGLLFIATAFSSLVPNRALLRRTSPAMHFRLICSVQAVAFGLLAALMVRIYTNDIIWISLAAFYSMGTLVQRGHDFRYQLSPSQRWRAAKPVHLHR